MHALMRSLPIALAAGLTLGPVATAPLSAQDGDAKAVYDRWCAGCHGEDGAGQGPGAQTMMPRPRDFTQALYQIRTTATGELPTDEDILRIIDVGMPGTAMPGWEDLLTRQERLALVDYLKTFSRFFSGPAPEPMDFGSAPGMNPERIADGRRVYEEAECWRCHGDQGRGDGASAPTLNDDYGQPIWAADLTENWLFNGGGSLADIYRRFRTGLDGTPMPTFSDLIDAGIVTEDEMWNLAGYVRSLSPEETPPVREVIRASLLESTPLPTTPDDEAWQDAERFYIPMVGQIILKPRWSNPRVDGLWVQALHDGQEVALLISWSDPSRSPDADWADFGRQVIAAMQPADDGGATDVGGPDQLVVQFPQQLSDGMDRPFFLQGDRRRPAELWTWRSDRDGAQEAVARGMGTAAIKPASGQSLQAVATHADGQWKVLMRRALATPDPADLQFPVSRAVPVAFQAFDGDHGEGGFQGSVSTWYFLYLQEAPSVTVLVAPMVALILSIGAGLMMVSGAQKRERDTEMKTDG